MKEDTELVLLYDTETLINGWTLDTILELFKDHGVVIYDSCNGGHKPKVIMVNKTDKKVKMIDVGEQAVQDFIEKHGKEAFTNEELLVEIKDYVKENG